MTENPKLEDMGSDNLMSSKISVSDHLNTKSDSFVVDMERFSHLMEKDINANSRITRNLSRKGSARIGEMKITGNERDTTTSPRASLLGVSTPEKPAVVAVGATTDHSAIMPQVHHQITITNGTAGAAESKSVAKKFSFRRSSPHTWTSDPRRILIFFATLSSMGTILLIYFTLSMGKLNGDGNAST
ncbi:hypothetical protein DH2020_017324 [Rehmannia glutinosa]|uniref:Transmembrane protein n=1 Tax=Rehmannia glutinosa TaxID=99300 RepID=A0ABR0WRN6_REHGL